LSPDVCDEDLVTGSGTVHGIMVNFVGALCNKMSMFMNLFCICGENLLSNMVKVANRYFPNFSPEPKPASEMFASFGALDDGQSPETE
jgi:hypothetical protein